jgi:hypothetical protein
LVVAQLSPTGTLTVTNGASGSVQVVGDVQGYFTPDANGSTYVPVTTARLVDTRNGTGVHAALAARGSATVQVTGAAGVPVGATAVVVNVTAVAPAARGYLSAGPALTTTTSAVNFAAGQTIANLVVGQLSNTGTLTLYNAAAKATDVLVDVQGYFTGPGGSSYDPVGAARVLDTRTVGGPLVPGSSRTVSVGGVAGSAVPTGATAVVLSVTAVSPSDAGFLSVQPVASAATSNINYAPHQTVANLVVAQLSPAGTFTVTSGGVGSVQVVVDVLGYLAPA